MPEASSDPDRFLYRGIHAGHPAYSQALTGVVVPADLHSAVTPEEHNLRWKSGESCYTSWTPYQQVAENFANSQGPGGLLLRVASGAPDIEDLWHWELSPDHWMEGEVLLWGIRIGVEVIHL